jgi:malate dehydrogenase
MDQATIDRLVKRTANGGIEIVNFLKTGSAYYAPSSSVVQMVEAIVKDKKRILPCAVWLQGEYGLSDVVAGVPIKIGRGGMEEIVQIKLTPDEQAALNKSAADVKANMAKLSI